MYLGIDIASVDGNKLVDWTKAKSVGVRFAIFRGTYKTWADPTWKIEATRARSADVIPGAYLFPVMDKGAPTAQQQVAAFFAACGGTQLGDLPPVLDVEFPGGIVRTKRARQELVAWVKEAAAEIKRLFKLPAMIYTSARVWDGEDEDSLNVDGLGVDVSSLLECPLWLARYPFKVRIAPQGDSPDERAKIDAMPMPPVPAAWGKDNVWIHQYQGDAIGLPGFTATADLNRFFDLRKGAQGARVKWAQTKLRIAVDGEFGQATASAVTDFQRVNGLVPDGIIGPRTFAYLCWVRLS